MDHDYYDFSSLPTRPRLEWPDGARVAFCIIVNLEHYELEPPEDAFTLQLKYGPARLRPFPDLSTFSYREYGNRVGIFGIMNLLDKYGIRGTAAMDATVAGHYPFLVKECQKRRWEFLAHGITARRLITSHMSEEQERAHIQTSIQAVERATGQKPAGWFGVEYSESVRTPTLLAEAGIWYVCDWPNDEQPYKMSVATGTMYSLPVTFELDDDKALGLRNMAIMDYADIVKETFDALYLEGEQSGRLLVLNLHPYVIGQPYRLKYLDQILAHICGHRGVWKATGAEIIDWYALPRGRRNDAC
jgi:peptidoglycan/xylan/chitin deacetylase (PgdA/CDA1 family)